MAFPELIANAPTIGKREAFATLTEALKTGAANMKLSKAMMEELHGPGQTRLTIDSEIILVTATAGTTVTILERAKEHTTEVEHESGAKVFALPTAESLRLAFRSPWKLPVQYATTVNLTIHAETSTTLEGNEEPLTIEGNSIALHARVLIKNQTEAKQNGIYEMTTIGSVGKTRWVLTRTIDANNTSELQDAVVFVEKGTVNQGEQFVQTATVTTVGTTAQEWINRAFSSALQATFGQVELKFVASSTAEVKVTHGLGRTPKNVFVSQDHQITANTWPEYEVPKSEFTSTEFRIFAANVNATSTTAQVVLNWMAVG